MSHVDAHVGVDAQVDVSLYVRIHRRRVLEVCCWILSAWRGVSKMPVNSRSSNRWIRRRPRYDHPPLTPSTISPVPSICSRAVTPVTDAASRRFVHLPTRDEAHSGCHFVATGRSAGWCQHVRAGHRRGLPANRVHVYGVRVRVAVRADIAVQHRVDVDIQ
jgi:hypothetical protein